MDRFGFRTHLLPISEVIDYKMIELCGLSSASHKRKKEFFSGRIAAKKALEKMQIQVDLIPRSEHGAPLWPHGYCGSLSHSDTHACAIVADTQDYLSVGLDLELISSTGRLELLRSQFLRPEEQQKLTKDQALIAFSAKEALYKMLFPLTDQFFGFDSACATNFDKNTVILTLTQDVDIFYQGTSFYVFYSYQSGHVISICFLKNTDSAFSKCIPRVRI